MLDLLRRRWKFFLIVGALGLAMRLLFIHFERAWDEDADVYAELGRNLLLHGNYGMTQGTEILPSLIRLPGYPLLLGFAQILFHTHWVKAVLLLQTAVDMAGCLLLAEFARRQASERAALWAFALGALCPFTAAYAASVLTESLSIFAVTLALYAFALVFSGKERPQGLLLLAAAAMLAMLLRPDGVLLLVAELVALGVYLRRDRLRNVALVAMLAVLPLFPWAARNWETFHVIEPLAPRHVNNPGEPVNLGFYRWLRTWSTDLSDTSQVYWQVGTGAIDTGSLPPRAFDSEDQRARTFALIAEYNRSHALDATLDARFAALAAERIHAHPVSYYVVIPAWRVADMWLRPRTEALGLDVFWWAFPAHAAESWIAVALGVLNGLYVVCALAAFVQRRAPLAVFSGGYLLLRCVVLGTMENSEPRYTLEGFPILILCAAVTLAAWLGAQARFAPAQLEES